MSCLYYFPKIMAGIEPVDARATLMFVTGWLSVRPDAARDRSPAVISHSSYFNPCVFIPQGKEGTCAANSLEPGI